ncbi:hypothetical protein [Pararhodobacter sp.]|uniref:hypothetical protein n=1 Tax=Pararhodobacter sp. TaxID=2127056 RepID=UPI002AFFE80B|nr:hypothetical protein [Pararhodobacter sp.]
MQHIFPSVHGLRTIYFLSSDKLWFTLAILTGLVIASEFVGLLPVDSAPLHDPGFGL